MENRSGFVDSADIAVVPVLEQRDSLSLRVSLMVTYFRVCSPFSFPALSS